MNWISDKNPTESGNYLVSIQIQRNYGIQVFNYMAHYETGSNSWFKYDPFEVNYTPTIPVEGQVNAWAEDVGVFLK